jgi:hypothetical protein
MSKMQEWGEMMRRPKENETEHGIMDARETALNQPMRTKTAIV